MTDKPEIEFNATIGDRIRSGRDNLKMSRQAVSDMAGIALSTLQAWENSEREPTASNILKLAEVLNLDPSWLLTGVDTNRDERFAEESQVVKDVQGGLVDLSEFIFVPRYDVRAAAGHGALNESEKPVFPMAFRRYWLENHLNVDCHKLFVIQVSGTSLEGMLNDGDVILVNGGDTDPKEGVYVTRMDGHLLVKLVQRLPGNILSVSSTNPLFSPFTVNLATPPDDFAVIGKVVWFGRTI